MMGRKREYNPSAIEQAGQRHWNEAWGVYRTQRNILAGIAFGALCLAGAAFTRSWLHDASPKIFAFAVNGNGPSQLTARMEVKIPDAQRIEGHLKEWIEDCRSVSSDLTVNLKRFTQCLVWMASPSVGYDKMYAWGQANNPQLRAAKYTVDVNNDVSVVPQSDKTWLIDWSETTYDRVPGRPSTISYWRMTVQVNISMPETQEEMNTDWDGVFVTDWNIKSLPGKTS